MNTTYYIDETDGRFLVIERKRLSLRSKVENVVGEYASEADAAEHLRRAAAPPSAGRCPICNSSNCQSPNCGSRS